MEQNKQILITFLLISLLFTSCSVYKTEVYKGKIEQNEFQNTYLKTKDYEGVIFSKSYIGILNASENKITPTLQDIYSSELILKKGIREINKGKPNQTDNFPIISENLRKYLRQYFGYVTSNGDTIIMINCFWKDESVKSKDITWKIEERIVLDGCSFFWSIKVNLTRKRLFDLSVNGCA